MIFDAIQKGFECASPLTLPQAGEVAVVREDDGAGAQGGGDFFYDSGGIVRKAIVARGRPTTDREAEFARGQMDKGIRHAYRGTESRRGDTSGLNNGG